MTAALTAEVIFKQAWYYLIAGKLSSIPLPSSSQALVSGSSFYAVLSLPALLSSMVEQASLHPGCLIALEMKSVNPASGD